MMSYNAILLDIDDTLYDYNTCHEKSSHKVFEVVSKKLRLPKKTIEEAYYVGRMEINIQLNTNASSHNRLLYFQKMLESLKHRTVSDALELYNQYWLTFVENIQLYDGVIEFLKKHGENICFVTDLTADVQHLKISKLGLDAFGAKLVTSEECGREKPSISMFLQGLYKLNALASEACMIGDNYKKDILGANALGIKPFWLKKNNIESEAPKSVTMIRQFKEIENHIK